MMAEGDHRCAQCGRDASGVPERFALRRCPGCGAHLPRDEATSFERRARLEQEYALAFRTNLAIAFVALFVARHLAGGIALVATSLALTGLVLAHRHGQAAVQEVTRKHNAAHPRGGLVREAMTLSGRLAAWFVERGRPPRG